MPIFVTGTGTDVGKTVISTWLCLQMGYDYFKPIQTGDEIDSEFVASIADCNIYPEVYRYKTPVSPHLAAKLENSVIDSTIIKLPEADNVIIEGAGGLLVPINDHFLMIDLIQQLQVPVILVAHSGLGTINHTLLSLEALRARHIPILGVILNGALNAPNKAAIEYYGKIKVLAEMPFLNKINQENLQNVSLGAINEFT
jgi:dethiobiotin synthetase